jgi:hypothetical protein
VEEEFRPGFGVGVTVVVAAIAVVSLVVVAVTAGPADALVTLPWMALLVTCCWATFWRPKVVVSDAGVRLVNVARTIDVPWPALVEVETRYTLTLQTAYGRFPAWAAPAPGAGSALRTAVRSRGTVDAPTGPAGVSMGELAGTASGDAATVVRRRWERLRDAGHLDDPRLEFERPPVRWHWQLGLVVAALALVSVGSLVVG